MPQEKQRSLWTAVTVAAFLLLGAFVLFPVGYFFWQFSGGWDGIRPQAEPTWNTVVAAREKATAALPDQQAELDAMIAPIAGEPLARGTLDGCKRGVNDWKIHHGYTLSCATAVVAVYPWSEDAAAAHKLAAAITERGYRPEGEHTALDSPNNSGHASGWYTSDNAEMRIDIHPPHDPTDIIYPGDDAYSDDDTQAVDAAIRRYYHSFLVVVISRTYFED